MDILPDNGSPDDSKAGAGKELNVVAEKTQPTKLLRRKVTQPDIHVVVGTSAMRAKVPKAAAKKLRKKLLETENENKNLSKSINEKNKEITLLKNSVDSLNEVLNSVPIDELRNNSSVASTKILELSKKNRQMRAEIEQFKSRVSKKDMLIEKLEKDLKSNEEKQATYVENQKKITGGEDTQAKINIMQQKLFDARNKNTELQNQLKLAQKCLQHEVGENVNINLLANNLSQATWRGRAQQILGLQQKLQELRARVDCYENSMTDRTDCAPLALGSELDLSAKGCSKNTPRSSKPLQSSGRTNSVASNLCGSGDASVASFDRFSPGVRKSEILHKAKVAELQKEILTLQKQLDEQRNRTLALKVRNKTLNDEMIKYKTRANELEDQNDCSGENASTLNEKLKLQRAQYENRLDELRNDVIRVTEERDISRRQMDELSAMNLELAAEINKKETTIQNIQDQSKKLETDLRAVTGGFLFSCREFRKVCNELASAVYILLLCILLLQEEFVGILDALEVEKNQLMLMNKTLHERLDAERIKNESSTDQIAKQKTRIARLETKVRDLEKDLDVQNDRKKRTQRINEYASALGRTPLTGSISSFSFDNQSQSQYASSINTMSSNGAEPKVEDMKNK